MIQIDLLLEALRRQQIPLDTMREKERIPLDRANYRDQIKKAMALRNAGSTVILEEAPENKQKD